MDAILTLTRSVCKPLLIYVVFLGALILYDITQLDSGAVLSNSLFLVGGSLLIWTLCAAGFEIAAWILLALFPFFFVALLGFLVVTQVMKTDVTNDDGTEETIPQMASIFGVRSDENNIVDSIKSNMKNSLGGASSSCSAPPPVQKPLHFYKLTEIKPVLCPTCSSTSTSS
jgi:hypothetical protein